jgi:predicted rRNA methylase YqxC with S4 and FtsJ domains
VVDLATIDLSYLPVAEAVQSLRQLQLGRDAALVAVITPTFGLGARSVVTDPEAVRTAFQIGAGAVEAAGWRPKACTVPAILGASGAVETFVPRAEATHLIRNPEYECRTTASLTARSERSWMGSMPERGVV